MKMLKSLPAQLLIGIVIGILTGLIVPESVMASLGLLTGILGFDANGTALMLAVFALQDSFGTACNITGDGALTLMLSAFADKHKISPEETSPVNL